MIVLFVLLIGNGSNVPFSNANGVTTMRTTGSVETYTDLSLKREIDAGHLVGPHLDVTGPYLEGPGALLHPGSRDHLAGRRAKGSYGEY